MSTSSALTFEQVSEALGFAGSPGFIRRDAPPKVLKQPRIWFEAIERFGIDAIFLIQTEPKLPDIPIIYFKKMEEYDKEGIIELHRKVWNQGKIPLLFVILPGEVRIYNCFEPPCSSEDEQFDTEKRLLEYLKVFIGIEDIRRELSSYTLDKLYSGRFWREKKDLFDLNNRADMHLLNNLRTVRAILQKEGLANDHIHRLIARSILILCLEDRGALKQLFERFKDGEYVGFREVLRNREHTYELFKLINDHFNGDIFPITDEEKSVILDEHLQIIRRFILGTDPETGQTRLWPYRFDIIPIEFISNIYEEFLQYEKKSPGSKSRDGLGTYYTPQFLVGFMLEGMLSWDQNKPYPKILDPSCGSGIFLVEAYRKLIEQKVETSDEKDISVKELKQILQECIYGVDIDREAISITAFSLYSTMMDYIAPDSLWQQIGLFPKLIKTNLFPVDFFNTFAPFNRMKFDVIIGNVPWASVDRESSTRALSYCRLYRRPIGDRQIAQAFVWKALDLCDQEGEICVIVGAKSLLFNRSNKNRLFRREFLKKSDVQTVVNLSALRRSLFNQSVGPAAIVHYGKRKFARDLKPILYIFPKETLETRYMGAIIFDKSDYARIPAELAVENDSIWKIATWGTRRDLDLIAKASSKGTLGDIAREHQWEIGDGFQRGGGDRNHAQWLIAYPHMPAKSLNRYYIGRKDLKKISNPVFHRPRDKKRYAAPLCLVKVTLTKGNLVAAFSGLDVSYTDGIIGISASPRDEDLLKVVCCYLNSDIARYFLFLTCSVWGVERDDILKSDLLDLPLVLPERNTAEYQSLLSIYDDIVSILRRREREDKLEVFQREIDSIFFGLFDLGEIERKLIMDTVNYTIDFFQKKDDSVAVKPVDDGMLLEYAENSLLLLNGVSEGTDRAFYSTIYSGSDALKVASFELLSKSHGSTIQLINSHTELKNILDDLSSYLEERQYGDVFLRRIVRIYESTRIHIIKPNEQRYWTRIAAYNDADDTLAEIFDTWRGESSA